MKKLYFSIIVLLLCSLCQQAFGQTPPPTTFTYTGAYQTYSVPAGVSSIGVDMYGGAGGWPCCSWASSSSAGPRALGGRVQCTLNVTPSSVLYVYVGGQGTDNLNSGSQCPGGWNGGGVGGASGSSFCAGGGGATDIRTSTSGYSSSNVIAVAGAGGGGGDFSPVGGAGGGTIGGTGQAYPCLCTTGGACGGGQTGPSCSTGSALGAQGQGGSCTCYSEGGGGGGWWGGNGGTAGDGAAGGGSSYPATPNSVVTSIIHTQGYSGATSNGQAVITVLCSSPGIITGTPPVCIGATATLADVTAGSVGTWSSSNAGVASVNPSTGVVTGVAAGTAVITYNISNPCGSLATATVNINPSPAPITGASLSGTLCTGITTALTSSLTGTWVSSNPLAATVSGTGPGTGSVTGVSAGVTTISYTLTTGCAPATITLTVNSNPSPISGTAGLCTGSTYTFTDATTSGAWTSSSSATASVSGGVVTAVATGTANISYTLPNGCAVIQPVTVNPSPAPIGGSTAICVGATSTLTDATLGGSWLSSNPAQATINAGSGLMTGVFAGSPTVFYTLSGTGCKVSVPVVINPLPAAIGGAGNLCVGTTTTLTDGGTGTWFTSASSIATIGVGSGIVTGISAGTATITYALTTGCSVTAPIVVNSLPTAYAVNGGGNYCSSTGGVHVGLLFGASGISYQLSVAGSAVGLPDTGANASLDFGLQSTVGTYTVSGTNPLTGCSSNMTGSVHVGINASPNPHSITGGGGYCISGAGALIGVDGSDIGTSYQVFNGSTPGATLTGTGSTLSFGSFTTPGLYTVTASNISSGCSLEMGGTATIYAYPAVNPYAVSGGGGYCPGGSGTHVTLPNSDPTVSYQLYYDGVVSGLPFTGVSGPLDFGTETLAGTYTVIATDGTSGCTLAMPGSTTVFNYTVPTAYTVTGGGNYCTGGAGQHIGLSFGSSGINYTLNGPGGPTTVAGSGSGVDFGLQTIPGTYSVVAVNPTTGCVNSMTGIASIGESAAPNVYTVLGGGSYCAGSTGQPVIISHTDPGFNYQLFRGSSPIGTVLAGNGLADTFGTYTTAGTYTVIATSSTAPCTSNMAGSAVININAVPASYLVIGGGNYCVGGTGAPIILTGSQTGVSYQVYNGGTTGTPEGTLTPGTGSAINFGLMTDAGSYTIVGVNASLCSANMTGSTSININPLPNVFNVTGGGDYCAGATGKHIGLDNSNTGVSYQLYKDGVPTGGTLVGSGLSLDYGLKTAAGGYTVVATNVLTGCKDTMSNIVPISIDPLPLDYPLAPGGSFCAVGGTGIDVNMPSSESGVNYQLYFDGSISGPVQTGTGGPLDFGTMTTPGTYTLIATNGATTCSKTMPGGALINAVTPPVFTVTGGGNFCAGDTGVHIILTGTTTSDQYQLFVAGSPVGTAITGTGAALDFGLISTAGTPYTVTATDIALSCANNMAGSATVGINPLPTVDSVTGTGAFCAGSAGVHVGLNASSTGISYQLFSGTTAVGSPVSGSGSSLDFGLVTSTGTYTAVGTDIATHCASSMANGAVITARPLPTAYRVSIENFGNYCAADSGLHIMLSNSDVGVDYQLVRGSTSVGPLMAGTGSAITLGLENVAGTYTIVATDPSTTCSDNMLGSSLLNIIPLPTVYTVTGGGSFCPSGTGVHVGLDGSQDGIFYQLYNDASTLMATQFGTGAAIDFGLQTASGSYMVVGNSAVTTCPNNMFGAANVTVDTLGTPVITLQAYPGTGVGVWHIDSMKVFISGGGGPNPTYQWFVNGHIIPGATNQTFTRYELFNNDVVSCEVTGSGPCGGASATESLVIALQNVGVATVSGNGNDVKLVPNPNNGSFTVKGTLGSTVNQEVTMEITNMLGQSVYTGRVMAQGGNIDQHIQLGNTLPNGMYLLNLRAGNDNMVFHFVIAQ